jgi:hypothetical protein
MIDKEQYERLARYLAAAYTAQRLGVSIATAERNFRDTVPGAYWFALAEQVETEMMAFLNDRMRVMMGGKPGAEGNGTDASGNDGKRCSRSSRSLRNE